MQATQPSLTSEARVATNMPRRYLTQLCRHFQHRLPVTLDGWQGRIEFPAGVCDLDAGATGGILQLRVTASDATGLGQLEAVVARHFERFAFREDLKIDWTRSV